jgi:cytochrome c biogenesis protein CcmG, thiol:disulfide interchange protein DsbE
VLRLPPTNNWNGRRTRRLRRVIRRALRSTTAIACLATLLCVSAAPQPALGSPHDAAERLDLARHRGRVVIVDFWASWCKPCRQSIPWLNSLRARYGASGLTIIGVNVDAQHVDAQRFLRESPIEFEVVFDPGGDLAKQFGVKGMPSSFVFDRAGNEVETFIGFRAAEKARHEATLERLLKRPASCREETPCET